MNMSITVAFADPLEIGISSGEPITYENVLSHSNLQRTSLSMLKAFEVLVDMVNNNDVTGLFCFILDDNDKSIIKKPKFYG